MFPVNQLQILTISVTCQPGYTVIFGEKVISGDWLPRFLSLVQPMKILKPETSQDKHLHMSSIKVC